MKSKKNKLVLFVFLIFFSVIPLTNYAACYWIEPPPPPNQPLKLAFFIYASDVATESIIRPYADILGYDHGYIAFLYEDPNLESVFDSIDNLEDYNDMLFFYFYGHGEHVDGQFIFDYSPALDMGSIMLRYHFDKFEAESIAVLMESCYSGEFVDRFEDNDKYLIMTPTDINHPAAAYGPSFPSEPIFSDFFWSYVDSGDDAITAFNKAKAKNAEEPYLSPYGTWTNRYPQKTAFYSGYNFF